MNFLVPESPIWLLQNDKEKLAYESLVNLRDSGNDISIKAGE